MKHFLPIILALAMIAPSCKTGKKAFKKGDYERALYSAINRLKKNQNSDRAQETLREGYPLLLEYYNEQIANANRSSDPLRSETVFGYYSELNKIYNAVQRTPAAKNTLPNIRSFTLELEQSKTSVVRARYALGETELAKGYRENAMRAYEHFKRVNELKPNYRSAEDKMYEAQDLATIIVQVEPIPMHSQTFKLSNDFFENQIGEYIKSVEFSPFVRFFSSRDARLRHREPDHILRMKFDDFVVGQAYVKETVRERSRDSVAMGTATVGDSTVTTYGTVTAEVTCFQKEIASGGLLNVTVFDKKANTILSQRKFEGEFVYYDKWGSFNGDKRALTEEDKEYIAKKNPSQDPLPQILFVEFTKPIYDQVTSFIRDYYSGF